MTDDIDSMIQMTKEAILLFLIFFLLPPLVLAQEPKEETLEGEVVRVLEEEEIEEGPSTDSTSSLQVDSGQGELFQKLEILITKGSLKDKKIIVEIQEKFSKVGQSKYKKGDEVLLSYTKDLHGKEIIYITDFVRRYSLFWLLAIFIALTILVARWRGATSLLGMGASFFVIIKFVLPQILAGHDPILIAVLGALLIVPLTFYLSHGFNKKTTVAILGTLGALGITGILAKAFVEGTKLTGFASEEAAFLKIAKGEAINIKGLLLAGIIIGSLGVLDDITISQVAIVDQLKQANSRIFPKELFNRAMSIGQDHIASMVNTLILVYAGAALPLLLLFIDNPHPFTEVINYEIVAEEVVRSLVSSTGLILAVPITTFLAAHYSDTRWSSFLPKLKKRK